MSADLAVLSFSSLIGFSSSNTIKIMGSIGPHPVLVLIDSGATYSFVSTRVVELALPYLSTGGYKIRVGNGMNFQQEGTCKGVQVQIQGYTLTEDFFPFGLGSANVVLDWLRTLEEVHADWSKFTMKFRDPSGWICWTRIRPSVILRLVFALSVILGNNVPLVCFWKFVL